ncbi:MAG: hypothetical protein KatS3mg102_2647 [Planctomycetota bacterium]|nr:MAG: hypothetical protein KatS3mg102_2647 [Planctomycetota bacterium]
MFGRFSERLELLEPACLELVRLAFPRRVYTQSHVDYVIEIIGEVHRQRRAFPGMRLCWAPPLLRAFRARLEPLGPLPACG